MGYTVVMSIDGGKERTSQVREAVKREMERRGLSIAALAELAGVWRPNLSRWLSGHRDTSLECAERTMHALGLEVRPKPKKKRAK